MSLALEKNEYLVNRHWPASLELRFAPLADKTRMVHNHSQGPLRVQRPFYPETQASDCCHIYLLHPPGGLVAGDHLQISVMTESGAHALLTTPASGKVYRSNQAQQQQIQEQHFQLASGSKLEWLPPETIAFNGAQGRLNSRFDLEGDAQFIAWELTCLGRPASEELFTQGQVIQSLKVYRDCRPLLIENTRIDAQQSMNNPAALKGAVVYGCMLATVDQLSAKQQQELQSQLREQLESKHLGITLVRGLLILRYLGDVTEQARNNFEQAWKIIRPYNLSCPAVPPRIWLT